MQAEQIVDLVFRILTIIGYVTLAILAIKRKKPTTLDNGNGSTDDSLFDKLYGYIVREIEDAEDKGSLLSGKSGFFKFDRVLSHAQEYCREIGLSVDSAYLTDRIEELVKLMNYSTSKNDNSIVDDSSNRLDKINYEEV